MAYLTVEIIDEAQIVLKAKHPHACPGDRATWNGVVWEFRPDNPSADWQFLREV